MQNNMLYLSVTQSRRLAVEMPVGNPFDGHFYGKKQMPVVAVVAGAWGAAAGAAALAAGATGLAAVAAGAMIVGGALTVIGTISGNQKLAKIGGILSLAGGLGSMAANTGTAAGTASSTADAATGAVATETAGNVASEAAGLVGSEAVTSVASDAATAGTEALSGMDLASDAVSAAKAGGDMAVGKGFDSMGLLAQETAKDAATNVAATEVVKDGIGAEATSPLKAQADVTTQTGGSLDAIDPEMQKLIRQQSNAQAGTNFFDQNPSMLSKLQTWVKENPKLAEMALSGGSAMLKGMVPSEADKAMMERYRQQTADLKRKAQWATGRV